VVLPMARAEGFENLLHGKVLQVEAATAVVELEPGLEIVATGKEMIAGRETVIGLRAEELILATGTPSGLSAQNILAGRVEEIRETGDIEDGQPQVLVVVIAGARGIRLVSAVTRQACRQLGLAAGMPVSLVFKAQSCRAIAAR